jgi:Domain of unknown function (DUF4386)
MNAGRKEYRAMINNLPAAAAIRPDADRVVMRTAAILLGIEGLLLFAPLGVLGTAIGWPASLGDPASVALPRLLEQEPIVRFGYLVYLAYSVLFLPVAVWTTRALTNGARSLLASTAIGFAVASTLARTIGILRWLTVMPGLARAYPSAPDQIALLYQALNGYGGGIGELLGVSLFAVGWLGCTMVLAWRTGVAPRWLIIAGGIATVALALPLIELAGVDPGALTSVGTTALQLWFLATAFVLARSPAGRRSAVSAPPAKQATHA